jgi:phosphoglycolate phosphatase-like HAD superfamily hydrolase
VRIPPDGMEAVIFDLDGTLADTLPVVVEAFQLTLELFDLDPLSQIEIFEHFGPTEDGVVQAMFGDLASDAVPVFYTTYERLLVNNVVPFAGVPELLRELRNNGLRVAVVTGKSERGAEMTLKALGLAEMFEYVRGGSVGGVVKSREISGLLSIWSILPGSAAYVGDHPTDVREARDAGVVALAAGWASTVDLGAIQDVQPDELFVTVEDFSKWLRVNQSMKG